MDGDSRDLDAPLPWWRLGFDGTAVLEAFVGTVVGLIWGYPDSVDSDQGLAVVSVRAAMYCCS